MAKEKEITKKTTKKATKKPARKVKAAVKKAKPKAVAVAKGSLAVVDLSGKEVGTLELDKAIFDGAINDLLIHQAEVMYLANQRKGLSCAKTRAEVSGSGKKPWRQKGTGRARIGSIRSPIWRSGGVTFAPKPRSYRKEMPKKMRALALKSALNLKLHENGLMIIDSMKVKEPKTKEFASILKKLKLDSKRVRLVVENIDENLKRSSNNVALADIARAMDLSTYEAKNCKQLVFTKDAITQVQKRIKKCLQ